MAIRSFDLTPEVDQFIGREVERGAYKHASELVCAAVMLLEREQEDDQWKTVEAVLASRSFGGDASHGQKLEVSSNWIAPQRARTTRDLLP